MKGVYRHLWRLLEPFHRDYTRYLVGIAVRQSLIVLAGYGLVWALRFALQNTGVSEWWFVILFIAYDAGLLRLDIGLNTLFLTKLGYPLYGRLRTTALAKVFE